MPPRASATLRSPHEGGIPPSEPPVQVPLLSIVVVLAYGNRIDAAVGKVLVPKAGLEPAWGNPHTPLKRACLPFHHFGTRAHDYETSRCPCQRIA